MSTQEYKGVIEKSIRPTIKKKILGRKSKNSHGQNVSKIKFYTCMRSFIKIGPIILPFSESDSRSPYRNEQKQAG